MIKEQLAAMIAVALDKAKASGELPLETVPAVGLEMPKNRAHGDWATSIALVLAPQLRLPPREVAMKVISLLPIGGDSLIAKADIAGPGFINLTLRPDWLGDILKRIEHEDDAYGRSDDGKGRKILVEFVSTNPNGPITVAGGRNAAIGDVLCNLLQAVGNEVAREYYINDALNSTQMNNFGKSVFLRYRQLLGHPLEEFPHMYGGEYIIDVARVILTSHGNEFENADIDDPQTTNTFRELSESGMTAQQKVDLEAFGVRFDNWFSEATLYTPDNKVQAVLDELTQGGHTYEKDGALWLKTLDEGDTRDNVLIRNNGSPTYLAGDIAYHKDKFDRGYNTMLNVWGADHGGAVLRLKAAMGMLGYDASRLQILLYQLVRIVKDGELVKSSKRRGDILELKADLVDEVGRDAARFFYLMRSPNTDLDIDIDLAKKTEKDNPVYYVQYAHARIVQTLEKARETQGQAIPPTSETDLGLLTEETETDLIKKLSDFPDEIRQAAQEQTPQRITQYARDLAALFHTFYDAGNRNPTLRVVCNDVEMMKARLVLVNTARIVLKNALSLLGLSAPDKM
jgi:arginyl-tRNA synthetase